MTTVLGEWGHGDLFLQETERGALTLQRRATDVVAVDESLAEDAILLARRTSLAL